MLCTTAPPLRLYKLLEIKSQAGAAVLARNTGTIDLTE